MRVRYTMKNGKPVRDAEIYDVKEHSIDHSLIALDARKVIRRLKKFGHESYIVGGAIRDLLLGREPKDFDIATQATPNRVRALFRNSFIIGKRFKLVHVFFKGKYIEVSTFRSKESNSYNDRWGTMIEDAFRRDFSVNALYYSPEEEIIIDYVGGMKDLKRGILFPLLPIDLMFTEDPVRIIRAVKYSLVTGLKLPHKHKKALLKSVTLLSSISPGRRMEEFFKILRSGMSATIIKDLYELRALKYFLPRFFDALLQEKTTLLGRTISSLHLFDNKLKDFNLPNGEQNALAEGTASILTPILQYSFIQGEKDAVQAIKALLQPIILPARIVRKSAQKYTKRLLSQTD